MNDNIFESGLENLLNKMLVKKRIVKSGFKEWVFKYDYGNWFSESGLKFLGNEILGKDYIVESGLVNYLFIKQEI